MYLYLNRDYILYSVLICQCHFSVLVGITCYYLLLLVITCYYLLLLVIDSDNPSTVTHSHRKYQ